MPTYEALPQFWRDWERLTPEQRRAFLVAVERFVADLRGTRGVRPGLRAKGVRGARGVYELTWAPDGRATFSHGRAPAGEEPHVIWRRIGTHGVLRTP